MVYGTINGDRREHGDSGRVSTGWYKERQQRRTRDVKKGRTIRGSLERASRSMAATPAAMATLGRTVVDTGVLVIAVLR